MRRSASASYETSDPKLSTFLSQAQKEERSGLKTSLYGAFLPTLVQPRKKYLAMVPVYTFIVIVSVTDEPVVIEDQLFTVETLRTEVPPATQKLKWGYKKISIF